MTEQTRAAGLRALSEDEMAKREAAWKEYKTVLEPRDDRALAREAFNEAWFACLRAHPQAGVEREAAREEAITLAMSWHPSENGPSYDETRIKVRAILAALPASPESAQQDTEAQRLYTKHTDNHPTIHSNRFPAWSELTEGQRDEWRQKVIAALPQGGE